MTRCVKIDIANRLPRHLKRIHGHIHQTILTNTSYQPPPPSQASAAGAGATAAFSAEAGSVPQLEPPSLAT